MKKLLLTISLIGGIFSNANAQLPSGSIAPDWTFTDINGQSWHLYDLTAQGKTVFIDVSATWCGPCWAYHNSHALEDLYTEHGPNGTLSNDVMVFYIEGDNSTTSADLNGTGTNTQGNWVTGTPYPIIDLTGTAGTNFNNDYAIAYFPTVYKVCTDNTITEVGALNAKGLVNSINSCTFQTDAYTNSGPASLQCNQNFSPVLTLKNNGQSTLTSCDLSYEYDNSGSQAIYNWTGSLSFGATASITLPQQNFTAGAHTLKVTSLNPNAGLDDNNTNNEQSYAFTINTASSVNLPLANSFTQSAFPYANWIVDNPDNSTTWARVTTNGGALKYDCYNYSASGESDAFILDPIDFTGSTSPSLNFNVAHARYSASYTEKLQVFVSSDCGQTWNSVWMKSGTALATSANTTSVFTPNSASQWRAECVDLSSYAGQSKLFVKFVGTNDYGNNIYVDDINISNVACSLSVSEVNINDFNLFPNPASDILNVSFEAVNTAYSITMMDLQGRVVATQELQGLSGAQNVAIPVAELAKGSYLVSVTSQGVTRSQTVVIK
ncbi:MAG: T9SS type A sorting domain-containing protein [Flavobacteriia bacterium]|jgi:hypothetical protein